MDFGRLTSVHHVDFALPADAAETTRLLTGNLTGGDPLADARRRNPPTLRIGTPRFAARGFLGKIYPKGTPPAGFLSHYCRSFQSIELNSTYYGVRPIAIRHWAEQAPDTFRFCPKFPQEVSHERELRDCDAATEAFFKSIAGFGNKLGPAWLVLPQTFGPRQMPSLTKWIERHSGRGPMALEFRHQGWFRDQGAWQEAMRLLEEKQVTTILTDVAGRRDVLHMRLTTGTLFLRFVGNRLHSSDYCRIDSWADRLIKWFGEGLQSAYVFLHQPDEHLTVELAEHLGTRMQQLGNLSVLLPVRVPATTSNAHRPQVRGERPATNRLAKSNGRRPTGPGVAARFTRS